MLSLASAVSRNSSQIYRPVHVIQFYVIQCACHTMSMSYNVLVIQCVCHKMSCHTMCMSYNVHVIQCHVIQRHVIQCHVIQCTCHTMCMSYNVMSYNVMSYNVLVIQYTCHTMSCHKMCMSYNVHVIQCHVLQCHVVQCHKIQRHVLQCHTMCLSNNVMSYNVMSYNVCICHTMSQGDYNVLKVEWNSYYYYTQSASDTRTVGAQIALIAKYLVANGLPWANLYCVGHSLGAHVCGFAGLTYKFPRITGRF